LLQYDEGDTIVAPATPPGMGALAVVRISGPKAISIAETVFSGGSHPATARPRTALLGTISDENGEPIDEVLLVCFPAPRSYTAEDSVEISCHGGPYLVRRIVERVVAAGARLAGPGEFTRRAFLNGKIDLAQAESVSDLIAARTEAAARAALRQLHGELSGVLRRLRGRLVDLLAGVEADLDFAAEEGVPSYDAARALRTVRKAKEELERLAAEGKRGRLVREGVAVTIVGRPNSGKSTLFNALLGEDRAIVSAEPGTTRDVVEGGVELGGVLFRLSDTAGLREGSGEVEAEGVRRARRRSEEADLLLVVIDRSDARTDEDRDLLTRTSERRRIVVLAKSDLPERCERDGDWDAGAVALSALSGDGMDALRGAMVRMMEVEGEGGAGDVVVTRVRHVEAIGAAAAALARAEEVTDRGELLAADLREAVDQIGGVTGEGAREEVLDRIFARFCIGK